FASTGDGAIAAGDLDPVRIRAHLDWYGSHVVAPAPDRAVGLQTARAARGRHRDPLAASAHGSRLEAILCRAVTDASAVVVTQAQERAVRFDRAAHGTHADRGPIGIRADLHGLRGHEPSDATVRDREPSAPAPQGAILLDGKIRRGPDAHLGPIFVG